MFEYKISKLTFSGGETISVGDSRVIIFVGANNVGKSLALNNLQKRISNTGRGEVIRTVKVQHKGLDDDIDRWYRAFHVDKNGSLHKGNGSTSNWNLNNIEHGGSTEARILVDFVDAESRLKLTQPQKGIDFLQRAYKHEIHLLQRDSELRSKISNAVMDAFGFGITTDMHFGGLGDINLRVGTDPNVDDKISEEYQSRLRKMPKLQDEGHGVRSYVGILMKTVVGHKKVVLIDEPELFLHPPQAYRIANLITENAIELEQQIFLATHSSEIIQGVLNGTENTTIIRINRQDNLNHAHELNHDNIKKLWKKPLLRSSNAMRGLFHEGVIVCEGDSDERFYQSLVQREDENFKQPADFYFVNGGSKGELATLAESYSKLQIPTAVIADFDVLRNKTELKKIIDVLGGDFEDIEQLYNSVTGALTNAGSVKAQEEIITELKSFISELENKDSISGGDKSKINRLMEDGRDWSKAKAHGIEALNGGKYQECLTLLTKLQKIGLFIVPVGEMECWDRSLSAKKNVWILNALELIDNDSESFPKATDFITSIADFYGQHDST